MIQGLLLRYGLTALAPFVVPAIIALGVAAAGTIMWWFELTDVQTTILLVVALGLVLAYAQAQSQTWRLVIVVAIGGVLYLKGTVDQIARGEAEVVELKVQHDMQLNKVHTSYKAARILEQERQAKVIAQLEHDAELAKKDRDLERKAAWAELKKLKEEAEHDKHADRPAFSADAVDRLNRLRYDPASKRRPARPKGSRGPAKGGKTSLLDDTSLSTHFENEEGRALAEIRRRSVGARHEAV